MKVHTPYLGRAAQVCCEIDDEDLRVLFFHYDAGCLDAVNPAAGSHRKIDVSHPFQLADVYRTHYGE